MSTESPPPPQVSPDGKFYWDGQRWVPMYGPKPLCFEASGAPSGKLTLLWSPDIFSPTVEIPLQ